MSQNSHGGFSKKVLISDHRVLSVKNCSIAVYIISNNSNYLYDFDQSKKLYNDYNYKDVIRGEIKVVNGWKIKWYRLDYFDAILC